MVAAAAPLSTFPILLAEAAEPAAAGVGTLEAAVTAGAPPRLPRP